MSDFVQKAHTFEGYLSNLMEKESLDNEDWGLCSEHLISLRMVVEDFQTENKKLLDFGCGWGGFLSNAILISKFKKICGVEIREECLKYLKKNQPC